MKNSKITILLAMFFALATLTFTGCGNKKSEKHEHDEAESHDKPSMLSNDEEGHSHMSDGHMEHMNDVREMLKKELGDVYDAPEFPEASSEQLEQGKKTFMTTCATCHGMTGKGDGAAAVALNPKPADFTDDAHSRFYSDQGRLYIIKNGVQGTGMTAWSSALSEEEMLSVYLYVRSLREVSTGVDSMAKGDYACPMHPEITSDKAGDKCSKCGMDLVISEKADDGHDHEH